MMEKSLLLTAPQARSSGLVISEMARIESNEAGTIVALDNGWVLLSFVATAALPLFDAQRKQYLYDTIKLGSYGPYLRTQTTEIYQACRELNRSSVPCTITGVRPIES